MKQVIAANFRFPPQKYSPLLLLLLLTLSNFAFAMTPTSRVEKLIDGKKWSEAARLIFIESGEIDRTGWDTLTGQAKAGFTEDALKTIEKTPLPFHFSLLMVMVRNDPLLSNARKSNLVLRALESTRSTTLSEYVKSGELANIALYYSEQGNDINARRIFAEAIEMAKRGYRDKGSGGFRQITDTMKMVGLGEVKPWMLALMNENLDYKPDPINTAFACIDLITVASHLGNSETKPFITCATAAINNISAFSSQKHHAIEELADAEWNIGMRDLKYSDSPMIEARHEAEQGNLEKAYKIISGFGETLYVNHKEAGYELLFDDAIKRSDLKAAVYFAERPPSRIYARDLTMWRRIAELQIHAGNRKSASMSYSKSSEALDQVISEKTISSAEIAQVLQLGNSMLRNGINHQGKHILMLAQSLADKGRTDEDKIKSLIFIASAFMQNEMFSNAKLAIKQAYSDAHRYDTTQPFGEMRKVELLTDIGNALIAISPKGSAPNSMLH